jgi:hypothetical protein
MGSDTLKPMAESLLVNTEDPDPKMRDSAAEALTVLLLVAESRGKVSMYVCTYV